MAQAAGEAQDSIGGFEELRLLYTEERGTLWVQIYPMGELVGVAPLDTSSKMAKRQTKEDALEGLRMRLHEALLLVSDELEGLRAERTAEQAAAKIEAEVRSHGTL